MKITNMILEKGEVRSYFRETLTELFHKKNAKSKCDNYRGINRVSIGNKLLSIMILFKLRYAVDNFFSEEQGGFREGRECVDEFLLLD